VFGGEIGAQPEITNLPLLGVSADRVNHDGTIAVSVARAAVAHFTHIVRRVERIFVEHAVDGSDGGSAHRIVARNQNGPSAPCADVSNARP
jgi:hypothetical protein